MKRKALITFIIFIFVLTMAPGLHSSAKTGKAEYTPDQEFMFKVFKTRRSVRKFKSNPVPEDHVRKIIDMARTAPTSGNQQPWKFLVITERGKIEELKKVLLNSNIENLKKRGITDQKVLEERSKRMKEYYSNYLSAPINIVVLTDSQSKYPTYNKYDGPLAAGYLMLAARALGYGTVFATDSIPPDITKKVFKIPENYEIVCFTPLGVPETWPESKHKKPLDEFIVMNKFIEGFNYIKKKIKKAIEINEKIKTSYTGKYKLNDQVGINITLKNGQLYIQVTGQPEFPMFAETETVFFLKVVDATITFNMSEEGIVKSLILKQSGREFNAERLK